MSGIFDLLATVISVLQILIIIRIILSYFPRIDPYNPAVRALRAIVDPILAPFRRILPTFAGIDFSPVLAILVLQVIGALLRNLAAGVELGEYSPGSALIGIVFQLCLYIIIFFCIVLLLRVILSMFHADPWHPIVMAIRQLTSPLVRPFSGILPRAAARGVEVAAVAALVAFVVLYFVARAIFRELTPSL
jgi:YggT family protein